MLRIHASVIAIASVAFAISLIPAAPAAAADQCVKIQAGQVNVRSSPGGTCIGSLNRNTKTKITGCAGNWCKLRRTRNAYIAKQFRSGGNVITTFRNSTGCGGAPGLQRCVR